MFTVYCKLCSQTMYSGNVSDQFAQIIGQCGNCYKSIHPRHQIFICGNQKHQRFYICQQCSQYFIYELPKAQLYYFQMDHSTASKRLKSKNQKYLYSFYINNNIKPYTQDLSPLLYDLYTQHHNQHLDCQNFHQAHYGIRDISIHLLNKDISDLVNKISNNYLFVTQARNRLKNLAIQAPSFNFPATCPHIYCTKDITPYYAKNIYIHDVQCDLCNKDKPMSDIIYHCPSNLP